MFALENELDETLQKDLLMNPRVEPLPLVAERPNEPRLKGAV